MRIPYVASGIVAVAILGLTLALWPTAGPSSAETIAEIDAGGSATFLRIDAETGERDRLWTVQCRMPFQGCVARSNQAVLRLDDDGDARITAFAAETDRISVQVQNFTIDRPNIFSRPLSTEDIAILDTPGAFVVIETAAETQSRFSTHGISLVVEYLRWLNQTTPAPDRDAREFQITDHMQTEYGATPPELAHLMLAEQNAASPRWQLVPYTKPQIEFAIRAQGGESFHVVE